MELVPPTPSIMHNAPFASDLVNKCGHIRHKDSSPSCPWSSCWRCFPPTRLNSLFAYTANIYFIYILVHECVSVVPQLVSFFTVTLLNNYLQLHCCSVVHLLLCASGIFSLFSFARRWSEMLLYTTPTVRARICAQEDGR